MLMASIHKEKTLLTMVESRRLSGDQEILVLKIPREMVSEHMTVLLESLAPNQFCPG